MSDNFKQYTLGSEPETNDFQLPTLEETDVFETIGANTLIKKGSLQSPNYVPDAQGYTLNPDGSAEFQDVKANGTFVTNDITIAGRTIGVSTVQEIIDAVTELSGGGVVRIAA